ncbi:hypothetical protein HYH02_005571 [Chlamydomonas schloesseri]|uniref:Uncharacterized protein n=1 Tax=Chlamydomonas schloesseri TaxID=2026947 RepID=A0A836B7B4_9CHLO|nr:hypothetical protein HYH02_005571 [Chlamydomonas schloesseri]|eukprot:KAG2449424.1 hypothetical protein HYH02_005571 [Chlamydomonas schloesseri]
MGSGEKGVMLCERPKPSAVDSAPGLKPFLPSSTTSNIEPLGLVPSQKVYPPSLAPKQVSATSKHVKYVRNLEQENREAALREEERRMAEAAKAESVTAFNAQLRAAILTGEDVSFWRPAKGAEAVRQSLAESVARAATLAGGGSPQSPAAAAAAAEAARKRQELTAGVSGFVEEVVGEANQKLTATSKVAMASFVDDLFSEAAGALALAGDDDSGAEAVAGGRADGTAEASTSAAAAKPGAAGAKAAGGRKVRVGSAAGKPAWALSSEQVEKLEEAEEEELLKFADDLDFDSFMASLDDPELQESVQALRGADGKGPAPGEEKAWRQNLVKAMNHVAMRQVAARRAAAAAGGDRDDVGSVAGMSEGGASVLSRATAASRMKSEAAAAKRAALAEGGAEGGGNWESSTRAGEDVARMERQKAAAAEAADFLRENPELRAVHSPASVRAMITKTEAVGAGAGGAGAGLGGSPLAKAS